MAVIPLSTTRAAGVTGHVTDSNTVHAHINAEIVQAADWGVAAANSANVNGAAIRQCIADSYIRFPNGYHIRLPAGTIEVDIVSGLGVRSAGAGLFGIHDYSTFEVPGGTIVKVMGASSTHGVTGPIPEHNCRLFNHVGSKFMSYIGHGIVDGNAEQLTADGQWFDSSGYMEGAVFWRTQNCRIKDLTFRNFSSTYGNGGTSTTFPAPRGATAGEEAFQVNIKRSIWTVLDNVTMYSTAQKGLVAGGVHVDNSTYVTLNNCRWDNVDVQGISVYGASKVILNNCIGTRNKRGFNLEYSWDVEVNNSIFGGFVVRDTESATADIFQSDVDEITGVAWTDGQSLANTRHTSPGTGSGVGAHCIFGGTAAPSGGAGHGGGNVTFNNCTFQGHGIANGASDQGMTLSNLTSFTNGNNSGTALTSSTAIFSQGMIGQYVQVGTDPRLHRIASVSSSTAATLGTSLASTQNAQTCIVYPGPVKFNNCTFADNNRHAQILVDGELSRILEFNNCTFYGATAGVDAYDLGPSNNDIASLESGSDVTTFNGFTTGTGLQINWAPCTITVYAPGNPGVSIGGRYANPAALTAIGAVETFTVPPGGFLQFSGSPTSVKAIISS